MIMLHFLCLFCAAGCRGLRMSGQKRPCDTSGPSSGVPPEKRRERDGGEDGGPGVSATAVETVIKLGGVSNLVRKLIGLISKMS